MNATTKNTEILSKECMQDLAGKYLTFALDSEIFGLEILKVQEIIGLLPVTRVPKAPPFVRGVINLRGKVIPVVELRAKFDLQDTEDTEKTCIIVVQIAHQNGSLTMGLIVDEVSEVLDIEGESIEPPPEFGVAVSADFILGVGKVPGKVIMLLDVDKILSNRDLDALSSTR